MNKQLGRLLLAGACCLAVASSAPAQPAPFLDDDAHPSHRLLEGGVGDLADAQDKLAQRLQHTRDTQEMQDLARSLLADNSVREMLKKEIAAEMLKQNVEGANPEEIEKHINDLKETIRKNPQILDNPNLRDMLKEVEEFKKNGDPSRVPQKTKEDVAKWAKDFIAKQQPPAASGNPMPGDPMTPMVPVSRPPTPSPTPSATKPSPPPDASKPSGWGHEVLRGMTGLVKDINGTPEGEALRTETLREIAKLESGSRGSSSSLADFLKGVVSSDQAAWLSQSWKTPSGGGLGGWNSGAVASSLPSFGGSSDGMMDAVLWIAALALLIAAGWAAVAVARRRADRARAAPWSPGPWPVHPSQVSTRQDLIRAFEHLAYLLLGRDARSLNHLDVAARLSVPPLPSGERGGGEGQGRAAAADRLAHLYEQARYAPPDEALPVHELTAARADLAALAGAAA